jgi:nitrate/nitrite-specific signal transduction histidine kinase
MSNIDTARSAYEAFGRGDLTARPERQRWAKEFAPLATALREMAQKLAERESELRAANEHLEQLARVARGVAGPRRDEQTRRFRRPYLDRLRRVLAELRTLPEDRAVADLLWSVERSVSSLEAAP